MPDSANCVNSRLSIRLNWTQYFHRISSVHYHTTHYLTTCRLHDWRKPGPSDTASHGCPRCESTACRPRRHATPTRAELGHANCHHRALRFPGSQSAVARPSTINTQHAAAHGRVARALTLTYDLEFQSHACKKLRSMQ